MHTLHHHQDSHIVAKIYLQNIETSYYLQDPLGQSGLLAKLLQVLSVGVVVDREIRLHGAQLVVLEAGAHALGAG